MPNPKDNLNTENEFNDDLDTLRFDNAEVNPPAVGEPDAAVSYDHSHAEDEEKPEVEAAYFVPVGEDIEDLTNEQAEKLMQEVIDQNMEYALDQDGRLYTDKSEFMNVLKENFDGKVFFICDGSVMRGVQNFDGNYKITEDPVTPESQIRNIPGRSSYEPKPSLKLSDIAVPTDYSYREAEIKYKRKPAEKIKKDPKGYVDRVRKEAEQFEKNGLEKIRLSYAETHNIDKDIFIKKPDQPVRPRLGVGNTMWRWFVKAVSLGQAETAAYKEYAKKKMQFNKEEGEFKDKIQRFNDRYGGNDQFEKDRKLIRSEFNKQLQAKKDALQEAENRVKGLNDELNTYKQMKKENQKKYDINREAAFEIERYHQQIEVKLQGVLDLQKNGKITKDNLFASNWMLRGSVLGKKGSELNDEDIKNIAKYIAAEAVESKMMTEYISNPAYDNLAEAGIASLNNESAEKAILESEDFKSIIEIAKSTNEPVDPLEIAGDFKRLRYAKLGQDSPITILSAEKQRMIERFGKRSIENVEEVALEVARFKALSERLEEFKKRKYGGKDDPNWKSDIAEARRITGDMHVDPFEIVKKTNIETKKSFTAPVRLSVNVRGQYEKVKPAIEKINERYKQRHNELASMMKEHEKNEYSAVKLGFEKLKGSDKFSLEEITKFVDSELGLNRSPEKKEHQRSK